MKRNLERPKAYDCFTTTFLKYKAVLRCKTPTAVSIIRCFTNLAMMVVVFPSAFLGVSVHEVSWIVATRYYVSRCETLFVAAPPRWCSGWGAWLLTRGSRDRVQVAAAAFQIGVGVLGACALRFGCGFKGFGWSRFLEPSTTVTFIHIWWFLDVNPTYKSINHSCLSAGAAKLCFID